MTIVAYKDGVIAADTLVCEQTLKVGHTTKITALAGGGVAGAAGEFALAQRFLTWAAQHNTCELRRFDIGENVDGFVGLIVTPNEYRMGEVVRYDFRGNPARIFAPFAAIGSGTDMAFGAMAAGATAKEAVAIAIQYDPYCGGDIHSLTVGREK
jgi:20S proteasome alpha/beta subunit